jgi:hypothetical protein
MKVSVLKKEKRFHQRNDISLKIQQYGEGNAYPQSVRAIVNASGTGSSCVDTFRKFINGKGFQDATIAEMLFNSKDNGNDVLAKVDADYAMYGGFALHLNLNANYKYTSITHVPFEHARFEQADVTTGKFDKIALHPDWAHEFTGVKRWQASDIVFVDIFTTDIDKINMQVANAGGWQNYKGMIFYYSRLGGLTYPTPIFDSVITDMNTEEGISNVSNRNARNNFMPAGMLVDKVNATDNPRTGNEDDDDYWLHHNENEKSDIEKNLLEFQGDENACKIMYVAIEGDAEEPKFIPFTTQNFDKYFDVTKKDIVGSIGRRFSQPPILRSEDVGSNFGANAMKNAYDFYNSVVQVDRDVLTRVFDKLLSNFYIQVQNSAIIEPLKYDIEITKAEELGANTKDVVDLIKDATIDTTIKRGILSTIYGFKDDQLKSIGL